MKIIELSCGYCALVDDGDYAELIKHKWFYMGAKHRPYVGKNTRSASGKPTTLSMHRFLTKPGAGRIDHKDGNGLNNQRTNLRIATHSDNMRAFQRKRPNCTSKYRGVHLRKRDSVWIAEVGIREGGKMVHKFKAVFTSEREAAVAYNKAAAALGFLPEALNNMEVA